MDAIRKENINGYTIEEYYWGNELIVYVNDRLAINKTYKEAVEICKNAKYESVFELFGNQ